MKFTDLKGRAVVNVDDAAKIGELDNLIIDTAARRVSAIKVKSGGLFSTPESISAGRVKMVGPDAITVRGSGSAAPAEQGQSSGLEPPASLAPDSQKDASEIIGSKVITDAGKLLGEVSDILFDSETLAVTGFEVREGGFFARSQEILADPDIRYGGDMLTVPAKLAQ